MATVNPIWTVIGGVLTDESFREELSAKLKNVNTPALPLQQLLHPKGLALGVSDNVHMANVLGPRWSEVKPKIDALSATLDLLDVATQEETAAAIGLAVPDTVYRTGLIAAADKGDYITNDTKSPGFPGADKDLVERFLDTNSDVATKLEALEKVMWHSPFALSEAKCDPSYNLVEGTIILHQTAAVEELVATAPEKGPTPSATLALRGLTEGISFTVVGRRPPKP